KRKHLRGPAKGHFESVGDQRSQHRTDLIIANLWRSARRNGIFFGGSVNVETGAVDPIRTAGEAMGMEGEVISGGHQHGKGHAPADKLSSGRHDNNTYTFTVEATGKGFQRIYVRRMNVSAVLRFVTPDGKELERWDESAPPDQVKNAVPPGTVII